MRSLVLVCVGWAAVGAGVAAGQGNPSPADPRDREIELLKKENELLKRELELLKKEVEQLKAQGGGTAPAGGAAKVTRDDVEYEFVSLKMDGNEGVLRVAVTAKKPGQVLDTQGIRLFAADGTEHRAPLVGVQKNTGVQTATLPLGVRTVVVLHVGNIPDGVKEFATIQLPGVLSGGAKRLKNPVVLKGTFKVER